MSKAKSRTVEDAVDIITSFMIMRKALGDALEYFDDRADAEYLPGRAAPVGNAEMRLAAEIRAAIAKADEHLKA